MVINRYFLRYGDGFHRTVTVDGTLNQNQILSLRKPLEDQRGPDDYGKWMIAKISTEMRETTPGVMELISFADLTPIPEDPKPESKYVIEG